MVSTMQDRSQVFLSFRTSLLRKNTFQTMTSYLSPINKGEKSPKSPYVKNLPWRSAKSITTLSRINCLMKVFTRTQQINLRFRDNPANEPIQKLKEILISFQMCIETTTNKNKRFSINLGFATKRKNDCLGAIEENESCRYVDTNL